MMYQLKFDIKSYWRAGTGRGGGALLDEIVHKDAYGLPCLPGRTVKGLLRDAVFRAEMWGLLTGNVKTPYFTQCWFGEKTIEQAKTRLETEQGALGVSDAMLDKELRDYLIPLLSSQDIDNQEKGQNLCQGFFHQIHATAIDEKTGSALKQSLRGMEVTIPLTLTANLQVLEESRLIVPNWCEELEKCLPLIRALGTSRSRGLGRVIVTLHY